MSGGKNSHFTCRSNGIDFSSTLGSYHQLIRNRRYQQVLGRRRFRRIDTHEILVVDTLDYTQRTSIHPTVPYHTILIRCSPGIDGSHGRRTVDIDKVVFSIEIDTPFFHQPLESTLSIHGRESLDIIGPQLIDGKTDNQLRNRRYGLSL